MNCNNRALFAFWKKSIISNSCNAKPHMMEASKMSAPNQRNPKHLETNLQQVGNSGGQLNMW